jgi:uncharacterized protein (DUF1778 family)
MQSKQVSQAAAKPETKPVMIRITPDAHRLLKATAAMHGQSMSSFVTNLVEQEATLRQ